MVLSKNPKVKKSQKDYKKKMTLRNLNLRLKNCESNIRAEEVKKNFTTFNEVAITNSPTLPVWTLINNLSQGDSASTIDGVSYANRGIAMKFLLHNNTNQACVVRLAVLRLKSGQTFTSIGENLFTGNQQLGLDFSSSSEYQRFYLPFNTKRYDIILQRRIKVGGNNQQYTENFDANKIIKGYKSFKNRKEYVNTSSGQMDTNYYLVAFLVPTNMDGTSMTVEMTGETCLYYKDN